jgi:hypothetical protein
MCRIRAQERPPFPSAASLKGFGVDRLDVKGLQLRQLVMAERRDEIG